MVRTDKKGPKFDVVKLSDTRKKHTVIVANAAIHYEFIND